MAYCMFFFDERPGLATAHWRTGVFLVISLLCFSFSIPAFSSALGVPLALYLFGVFALA